MSLFPGTPGTPGLESRKCPESVPGGVPGLWELITLDFEVWSRQGLNQTCSPRRDLSNYISHFQFGGREEVDSRLLVVGSQIASLTPGPSFAHNLGYRCSNDQCEAILYIYASRPFQWHQEHLNARCFGPCCRAMNIWESRRTPNPHFFQVLGFTPTLGQSGVATCSHSKVCGTSAHIEPSRKASLCCRGWSAFALVGFQTGHEAPVTVVGCGMPTCRLDGLSVPVSKDGP